MKKLLILSGKGGTGKTTVAASFIRFSGAGRFADCDVDAPNLHILMKEKGIPEKRDYYGSLKASIREEQCVGCGKCMEHCRFHAIEKTDSGMRVNELLCEGCGVCELVCPENAVTLNRDVSGELMKYESDHVFTTACLKAGRGNSGKLVTEVKMELNKSEIPSEIMIVDGSPGIGCPVIASVSGMDLVLAVIEPSVSGISDLERLFHTVSSFRTEMAVCVNKYDLCPEKTEEIKEFCKERKIFFAGTIPYDPTVINAVNQGMSIADTDCPAQKAIKEIYDKILNIL